MPPPNVKCTTQGEREIVEEIKRQSGSWFASSVKMGADEWNEADTKWLYQ